MGIIDKIRMLKEKADNFKEKAKARELEALKKEKAELDRLKELNIVKDERAKIKEELKEERKKSFGGGLW